MLMFRDIGPEGSLQKDVIFFKCASSQKQLFFVVSQLILSHAQLVEDFLNYLVTSTKLPWRIITVDLG
jgi:uncharacterized membrane protein YwzB